MDLYAVKAEVATVLDALSGLRAYAWTKGTVSPPAALVGWPDEMEYVQTYGRGQTHIPDLPVLLVVGKADLRSASINLGAFVKESGALSVPAALEAREGSWVACDSVTVTRVGFPAVQLAGVDMLAAEFHLDVTGTGKAA